MNQYTTLTLVPFLQSTSGNAYIGNAVPAASYYGGQGSFQTIVANVAGFTGNISIRATLNDAQESAPWFEIANVIAANTTQVTSNTIVGNFTWIQAVITDFAAGNVNLVTVSY